MAAHTPKLWRNPGSFIAGVATASLAFSLVPSIKVADPLAALGRMGARTSAAAPPGPALPANADLQQIAAVPHPELDEVGMSAEVKNAHLPFAHAPAPAAAPFAAVNLGSGIGQTALQCLTQAVYYEAGQEPLSGRRAVAQVVLNRLRHPAFPKSVCGVVYQGSTRPGCQFSFTCDGSLARRPVPAIWEEARRIAADALEGHVEPAVGYATHYHANYVYPYWAPRLVKLAKIGAHIFYRWPGSWGTPSAFQGQYAGAEAIPAWRKAGAVVRLAGSDAIPVGALPGGGPITAEARLAIAEPGGRIDTTTGWRMHISDPAELNRASAATLRRQTGINPLLETTAGSQHENP